MSIHTPSVFCRIDFVIVLSTWSYCVSASRTLQIESVFFVYYDEIKREIKRILLIYECRCNERLTYQELKLRDLHSSHTLGCVRDWTTTTALTNSMYLPLLGNHSSVYILRPNVRTATENPIKQPDSGKIIEHTRKTKQWWLRSMTMVNLTNTILISYSSLFSVE